MDSRTRHLLEIIQTLNRDRLQSLCDKKSWTEGNLTLVSVELSYFNRRSVTWHAWLLVVE
jgi:hypothetical protein